MISKVSVAAAQRSVHKRKPQSGTAEKGRIGLAMQPAGSRGLEMPLAQPPRWRFPVVYVG